MTCSAAVAALPVLVGTMSSSADDINVVDSSAIFIGTTDDEGWAKYGFSDHGSDGSKPMARKKAEVKKEEEQAQETEQEKEQEKEDEVIGKLSHMAIDPVPSKEPLPKDTPLLDAVPSKEPLPKSSSSVDAADNDSKESFPGPMVDAAPSGSVNVDSFEAEPLPFSEKLQDHTGEADFDPMEDSKGNEELMLESTSAPDKDVSMTSDVKKTSLPSGRSGFGISQTLPASLAQLSPFIRDPSISLSNAPDSDSNVPVHDPAPPGSLPRKSSLKRRSQSRGRGSQQHESRSRSRTSVERRADDGKKPGVSTISGSALPGAHLGPTISALQLFAGISSSGRRHPWIEIGSETVGVGQIFTSVCICTTIVTFPLHTQGHWQHAQSAPMLA